MFDTSRWEAAIDAPCPDLGLSSERFAASLSELARVRAFVQSRANLTGAIADRFILAVHEAAANVVLHALGERAKSTFRVHVERDPARVTARLTHTGPMFNPLTVASPHFDGSREGGFGLHLIALCVDSVTYDRDEGGASRIVLSIDLDRPTNTGARADDDRPCGDR